MAEDTRISFNNRTYTEIKTELISLIRNYYPEILQDFSDSSVGTMLIDLNAAVANNLSVNTDRAFQETQLEYAQQRASVLEIAKNLGFNIPNTRPSITVVDFTVTVPVKGDSPDEDYFPQLLPGSQVVGGGTVFETQDVVDWNSSINEFGDPNRAIIPNLDSNGIIQSYNVTKREVVLNGSTSIYKLAISASQDVPFFTLTLPDVNVLEIQNVILLPGTNFSTNPTEAEWNDADSTYYEVDYLAQQRVFVDDPNSGSNSATTGNTGIKAGKWINVTRKFIKEFTNGGFCTLTFGSGDNTLQEVEECMLKIPVNNQEFLRNILSTSALGEKLKRGYTLFVRYRTGGGTQSNVGEGVLTNLGAFQLSVQGSRQDFNQQVQRSLTVRNPIPAIGGNSALSTEEVRNLVAYNFSAQNRAVTINDYLFKVQSMPGRYGSPFRANAFRENNKVAIPILSLDSSGNLSNTSNTVLKENIAEYLSEFRMVNDYVEIRDGRIFNLAFDFDLFVDETNENNIANAVINAVSDYFDVRNSQMNEDIFLTPLIEIVNNIQGVVNVLDITIYNKVGGDYSVNPIPQEIVDEVTGQILVQNQTIYSTEDSMFEIKFPNKDIRVFLRKKVNLGV
jgi:hypothetical protein